MLTDALVHALFHARAPAGADNCRMHLLLPFAAAASDIGTQALQGLQLPHLERLLARLQPGAETATEAQALNLPHEHVLAACRGWALRDGGLPLAAWSAQADGLPPAPPDVGWGLLTPTHWQVGSEQILLLDPAALHLDEDESRALWRSLRELFDGEGWALYWGAPLRWYATHGLLADLATASLERVVGQPIDRWLPERSAGRVLRRLQSEAQMLLHTHPVNAAREARGELPVNSFWLSGTGRTQVGADASREPLVDDRLRGPWLAGDWAAWAEAWRELDVQRLQPLHARLQRGESLSLTLCGERVARRFDAVPRAAWQRLMRPWRRASVDRVLEQL